jgi:hypothetical protein
MSDSDFCFTHNPEMGEERALANQRGGQVGKANPTEPLRPIELSQPKDVVVLLQDTIRGVRAGEIDLKVANSVGYLSGHLLKAHEVAQLQARIEFLETILASNRVKY